MTGSTKPAPRLCISDNREWGNRIGLASYDFTFAIGPA